jgi:hypothetical protein
MTKLSPLLSFVVMVCTCKGIAFKMMLGSHVFIGLIGRRFDLVNGGTRSSFVVHLSANVFAQQAASLCNRTLVLSMIVAADRWYH